MARHDYNTIQIEGYIIKNGFYIGYDKKNRQYYVSFLLLNKNRHGKKWAYRCRMSGSSAEFWKDKLTPGIRVMTKGSLMRNAKTKEIYLHIFMLWPMQMLKRHEKTKEGPEDLGTDQQEMLENDDITRC